MDKSILRKFATESRIDLMAKMKNKINLFYIDEEFEKEQRGEIFVLTNNNHSLSLSKEEYQKRELLIKRIKDISIEQVIEESAYTWFNRIIAIRYMELNDILPISINNDFLGFRVLSAKDNALDPEILKFTNLNNSDLNINLDKEYYLTLKTDNDKFKYILLLICKKLGKIIPQVFDGITDYIDLLIPDNLLNDSGFVNKVISEIPEDNFKEVEIIGWLYQYYNQNEKDRVISSKKAYKKNEIAYATQLFTPDWIVKYMVENSLGKYVIEHNGDKELIKNWKYFIKDNLEINKETINPTEITFIDPCMGSGHILVYAFEVLYQIYESYGYNRNDIPELILKNNLHGLDIDDRAGQLAVLSVVLKACNYNKKILNSDVIKNLNILSIQESNNISDNDISYLPENVQGQANELKNLFLNGKELGSFLITNKKDHSELLEHLSKETSLFTSHLVDIFINIIKQLQILSNKYDIVVTNPPYMGNNTMNKVVYSYLKKYYNDEKMDLYTVFISVCNNMVKDNGYISMITQQGWLFLPTYYNLRLKTFDNNFLDNLLQLGAGAFDSISGEVVQSCAFVINKSVREEKYTLFYKLDTEVNKEIAFLENKNIYLQKLSNLKSITGFPIAYWLSNSILNLYNKEKTINNIAITKQGLKSSNDSLFFRFWHEVKSNKVNFEFKATNSNLFKWVPLSKGGKSRWYGDLNNVINWENDGLEIKQYAKDKYGSVTKTITSIDYYFKMNIAWNQISMTKPNFKAIENGYIFCSASPSLFVDESKYYYILALMNSVVASTIIKALNPTINFGVGDILKTIYIYNEKFKNTIEQRTKNNIIISKKAWDSFETSWDFKNHPLLEFGSSIYSGLSDDYKNSINFESKINNYGEVVYYEKDKPKLIRLENVYSDWEKYTIKQFNKLKSNEEELNRIFIDIYGLQDELDPYVEDKDITIRKADKVREIKSLISYAVGCMFGRYSLDETGLVYAGGEFDSNKYKTYKVDIDNIIPITDDSYFADDIVSRFIEFIKIVYGESTLYENLEFIADALGKRGTETNEETIRRYFNNDFFADHCKIYKKKPIYWLFDSGKKNGFKCLIYMHRYNENLVPKVRLDYLHKIQNTYEKLLSDINYKLTTDLSMIDKKELTKKQIDMNNKLIEIREYDEKIAHIADKTICIDLDDGVTANHAKFEDILAKIK